LPRHIQDTIYKYVTAALGAVAIAFIAIILIVLFQSSYPSFVVYGTSFFTTVAWNADISGTICHTSSGIAFMCGAQFGVVVFVVGTLISSAIALLIGAPTAIALAIFLSQVAPRQLTAPISFLTELMAGIPSVIFGFWGLLVLAPYLKTSLEPGMQKYLSFVPFFGGTVYSYGLMASGIILALMIIPIIASISRDAMRQTPASLKEAGKALGMTDWEITRKIVLPYAKSSIVGSVALGLGRALGETMAVALVCGFAAGNLLPKTAYYPINTIAAFIVLSLDSAFTDPSNMSIAALAEMALLLMAITMIVNVIARLLVRKGFVSRPENLIQI
jgi:phosphate transport system permease protein